MILELLLLLISLLVVLGIRQQTRPKGFPPGPTGVPVLGYAPFLGPEPQKKLKELRKKYGRIFSIFLGTHPVVVLNDVKDIKAAWKMDIFSGRPADKLLAMAVVPDGIVFNEGPTWQEQRRFTIKVLRDFGFGKQSMEQAVGNEVRDLMIYFRNRAGQPFDPHDVIQISLINALWMMIANEKFSLDDPRPARLQRIVHEGFIEPEQNGAVFFLPWLAKLAPELTGFSKVLTAIKEMNQMLREVISQHEETRTEDHDRDFIDVSIRKIAETTDPASSFYKENGIKHLVNTLITLFTAGADTSTSTLSFFILYMVAYPDIMRKVQDEIDSVVGTERPPTLADKPDLPYTEAVLAETLRHSSILHQSLLHSLTEPTVFEGFKLPARTIVMSNLYDVHHDEELWENPEKFWPDRFLSSDGKFVKNENLIPFSVGKRVCPAENVAMVNLFAYASSLLQNFTLKKDPNSPLPSINDPKQALVLSPKPFKIIMVDRILH